MHAYVQENMLKEKRKPEKRGDKTILWYMPV